VLSYAAGPAGSQVVLDPADDLAAPADFLLEILGS
jgi:hypothetical protein